MTRPGPGTATLWAVCLVLLGAGIAAGLPSGAVASPSAGPGGAPGPDPAPVATRPAGRGVATHPAGAVAPAAARPEALPVPAVAGASVQEAGDTAGPGVQLGVGRVDEDVPFSARLRSLLGLLLLTALAWALSTNRSRIPWRVVVWGLALQLLFAVFILKTPVGRRLFEWVNDVVVALLGYTVEGARFVFGNLVVNTVPVGTEGAGGAFQADPVLVAQTGAYFAFTVLPTIIFFSSLMTLLYHLGVMQAVVKGVAWVMQRTMGTSGAETLSAAGNIFVGQTEAPLLIKPFVERMTTSELMAVMTGGFATVAGGVMAAFVGMLVGFFPDIAGHLMAASVMSAPAALVVAKLMVPEEGAPETAGTLPIEVERPDVNVIDAAARGASEGLFLALNVGAMVLAFVALVALVNGLLGLAGGWVGVEGLTLEAILGWLLAPLAWIMGVPWAEAPVVAQLMGVKTVINEFVAFLQLSSVLGGGAELSGRSVVIATYALSGFANFSSIAIQIGGIGGIAPSRRHDLSRLGLRAMVGGSIAAFMTASVAGMLV